MAALLLIGTEKMEMIAGHIHPFDKGRTIEANQDTAHVVHLKHRLVFDHLDQRWIGFVLLGHAAGPHMLEQPLDLERAKQVG